MSLHSDVLFIDDLDVGHLAKSVSEKARRRIHDWNL